MCGIAGVVVQSGLPKLDALRRMSERLIHRGPDSFGEHVDGSLALAHRRLSIIDLAGGQQPLYSGAGSHCLIANGEIYNFPELRAQLEDDGHHFVTRSDCEVILPLYDRYGRDCVEHMRGMFGFALWDKDRRKLLLGRDRMGEKPIYYAFTGGTFVFASELRALLGSGLVDRNLDPKQIARYFRYQYVPDPHTPFLGIQKVPAGATLELDMDSWTVDVRPYWSAWDAPALDSDPLTTIREALEDATSAALIADVPIGLSLSGGIDSSILACLMRAGTDRPIHAISIGYPEAAGADERPQARALAQRLGITFHSTEICDEDMLKSFRQSVACRDDPIGDISGYNYYAIMRHARENGIKVMLQGHGLDELCWGYPWVKNAVAFNEGRSHLDTVSANTGLLARLKGTLFGRDRAQPDAADPKGFQMFELQPYTKWVMDHAREIFTADFRALCGWDDMTPENEYGESGLRTDLEVTRLITEFYLRENGIAQGDRLSMAHSVEARLPFVDHKLVETIIGLRKSERDDGLPLKHLLKESVRDLLGAEILDRPKRGFAPPTARWQAALRDNFGTELSNGFLVDQGILLPEFARALAVPDLSDVNQGIVSRMAIILETWARAVVLEENSTTEANNIAAAE